MASLSRDWTGKRYFQHALSELGLDMNTLATIQRFELMDQAQSVTASMLYDLVSNSYLTPITIVPDTTGRYSASSTGTWVAATRTLTFVNMNTDFGSGDVGKTIIFRVGALVYIGQVATFVSVDAVTVTGHNLPASNVTVNYVLLSASTPTGNNISLVGLRMMRTAAVKLVLASTATENVVPMSEEELNGWQADGPKNNTRIAWALAGELINLRKGSSLTTYGTFTLTYPRVPYAIAADTDYIDLPDGALVNISLIKLQMLIAGRVAMPKPMPDKTAELRGMIDSLYRSSGKELSQELIRSKIQALL